MRQDNRSAGLRVFPAGRQSQPVRTECSQLISNSGGTGNTDTDTRVVSTPNTDADGIPLIRRQEPCIGHEQVERSLNELKYNRHWMGSMNTWCSKRENVERRRLVGQMRFG